MPTASRLAIIAILCISLNAFADAPGPAPASAPVRTILERHDQTAVAGKEVGYVLKGPLVLKKKGQPDRILKTGDTFFNARGEIHSLTTQPGSEGGTAVSTWIVDKDQPLSTPAPN